MCRRLGILGLVLTLLCLPTAGQAQWAVFDSAAGAQRTLLWAQEALQWAQSLANQAKEIQASYNIILNQIHQLQWMADNMQRLPPGLNMMQAIQTIGQGISGLLGQANILSYDLTQAQTQFTQLYQQVGQIQSPSDILALRGRLVNAQMETGQVTVNVTAIRTSLTDLYTKLNDLLGGSYTAHGALDSVQVAAQQSGYIQSTLANLLAVESTHARTQAQEAAKDAALERVELQAIQDASQRATPYTAVNGHAPTFTW